MVAILSGPTGGPGQAAMPLQPLPAFTDNYIWALDDGQGDALVVDPGDAAPVLQAAEQGLRPQTVLLTHHHDDHIGGVAELRRHWPDLRIVAPDDARIRDATERVGDGAMVEAGPWRFQVLSIPGHTRSHIAYVGDAAAPDGDVLFCGDTLFSLGCGRMFEGTPPQMLASLDRLAALPGELRLCCGHEYTLANAAFALTVDPDNAVLQARAKQAAAQRAAGRPSLPSTLAEERAANPFLRVDAAQVTAAATAWLGHAPANRSEVFAALRRWKDGFRA